MEVNQQSRRCLKCGQPFASLGPGNRICGECHHKNRGEINTPLHRRPNHRDRRPQYEEHRSD